MTATLSDGRKLTGKTKSAGGSSLRLPKRDASSFIADVWKKSYGITGSDRSDDEGTPAGDATPGDGLTLYEEYRGFYVNSEHVGGNPAKKDYFAQNQAGAIGLSALNQFARLTRLEVHDKLGPAELPPSRIINANVSAAPHLVDQHAVVIKIDPSLQNAAKAYGGPLNPKNISYIGLPAGIGALDWVYARSSVVHELLHSVNVYHHGSTWFPARRSSLERRFATRFRANGCVSKRLERRGLSPGG